MHPVSRALACSTWCDFNFNLVWVSVFPTLPDPFPLPKASLLCWFGSPMRRASGWRILWRVGASELDDSRKCIHKSGLRILHVRRARLSAYSHLSCAESHDCGTLIRYWVLDLQKLKRLVQHIKAKISVLSTNGSQLSYPEEENTGTPMLFLSVAQLTALRWHVDSLCT